MRNDVVLAVFIAGLGMGCATYKDEAGRHAHGPNCPHTPISHQGHIDYLHNGYMHSNQRGFSPEHRIEVTQRNPEECTGGHGCYMHDADHKHSNDCGHPQVPHGRHLDYLVGGHLHHAHWGHCDDHGGIAPVVPQ